MNRFLTLLAATVIVMTAMAQSSGIVLSYNKGKELKYFRSNQLTEAINAAEVNDTLYFGPGDFSLGQLPDYRTDGGNHINQISKPLTFIGVGRHDEGTQFVGGNNIAINIDSSLDESKKIISFEGIAFQPRYSIIPVSNLKELKFINVYGRFINDGYSNIYVVDNLVFDGCCFDKIHLDKVSAKKVDIKNSVIDNEIKGGADSSFGVATLDHCFINNIQSSFVGLVQHSLIKDTNAVAQTSLVDCYYYSENGSSSKEECNKLNDSDVAKLNNDPSSLGNCNDGTPYGTSGGVRPISVFPPYPTPDLSVDPATGKPKSFVDYDNVNKKLKITVNILGN